MIIKLFFAIITFFFLFSFLCLWFIYLSSKPSIFSLSLSLSLSSLSLSDQSLAGFDRRRNFTVRSSRRISGDPTQMNHHTDLRALDFLGEASPNPKLVQFFSKNLDIQIYVGFQFWVNSIVSISPMKKSGRGIGIVRWQSLLYSCVDRWFGKIGTWFWSELLTLWLRFWG